MLGGSSGDSASLGKVLGRALTHDELGGAVEVVILAGFQRPEEHRQCDSAGQQRDRDQGKQNRHLTLKAFRTTRMELVDIASAAASGLA